MADIVGIKPLVAAPCFYEPTVNRTYAEMAAHYNTAIVPAVGASLLINALVAPKIGGQADARSHHRRAESCRPLLPALLPSSRHPAR
jgi:hypothetical protein